MSSVNKVILVGRVGKSPELRTFQDGGRVANFSMAVSEKWKDKNSGEYKEKTEWVNVSVTNSNLVSVVERFVTKGSQIYIEGQLQTRKWTDSNGVDKYATEVVLKPFRGEIVLLDSKKDEPKEDQEESIFTESSKFSNVFDDDEIPFAWVAMIAPIGLALISLVA